LLPSEGPGVAFELGGVRFEAFDGGPRFTFSDGTSFLIRCETQAEVDHYWERLLEGGGQESRCGWLKDRFGVSWQVVPTALPRLLRDPDPERARPPHEAMPPTSQLAVPALAAAPDGPQACAPRPP